TVPHHRHGRGLDPDVDGHDDAAAGNHLAAVQDHLLRAGRRLVPGRGLAGAQLCELGFVLYSATMSASLLTPDDPPPVEVVCPDGQSDFLITCDHSGRAIPKRLGDLGVPASDWERHIAWDIGAAGVARALAERLDAVAILQAYSRLVIDCNR